MIIYGNEERCMYPIKDTRDLELYLEHFPDGISERNRSMVANFLYEFATMENRCIDEDSPIYAYVEAEVMLDEAVSNNETYYGIPELKKYPMNDVKHVLLAIKFFNHYVGTKHEKSLADRINDRIQYFKIPDSDIKMTDKNQFKKYYVPYKGKNTKQEDLAGTAVVASPSKNTNRVPMMDNTYGLNPEDEDILCEDMDKLLESFYDESIQYDKDDFIDFSGILSESFLLREDIQPFIESINIKKILSKPRNAKKEIDKNKKMASYVKSKYGVDIRPNLVKYKKPIAKIKKAMDTTDFNSKKSVNAFTKVANSEMMWILSNALEDASNKIGEILETVGDEVPEGVARQIVQSCILFTMVFFMNTIIVSVFVALAGPIGVKVATSLVCPICEEIAKLTAEKYIEEFGSKGSVYNIVFNVFEFSNYAMQMYANGIPSAFILLFRTPAIIIHTLNTYLIKKGIVKKNDKKNDKPDNRIVIVTILIHCVWNAFGGVPLKSITAKLDPTMATKIFGEDGTGSDKFFNSILLNEEGDMDGEE